MSDTFTTPPAEAPSGKGLTMKVGSFPLYVWFIILGAGIGAGLLIRKLTSGLGAKSSGEVGTPAVDPYAGFTTQGAAYGTIGMNGGTGATAPEPEPETNNSWVRRAVTRLVALGFDAATVDSALRKYVNGEALSQSEMGIVSTAIQNLGPPPEEVPSIIITQPEPPTQAPTETPPPPPTQTPVVPTGPSQEEQRRLAWYQEAERLTNLANSGNPMSDEDLYKMQGMGFTTSQSNLSAQFRFLWRIWLNAHGYTNDNG